MKKIFRRQNQRQICFNSNMVRLKTPPENVSGKRCNIIKNISQNQIFPEKNLFATLKNLF